MSTAGGGEAGLLSGGARRFGVDAGSGCVWLLCSVLSCAHTIGFRQGSELQCLAASCWAGLRNRQDYIRQESCQGGQLADSWHPCLS